MSPEYFRMIMLDIARNTEGDAVYVNVGMRSQTVWYDVSWTVMRDKLNEIVMLRLDRDDAPPVYAPIEMIESIQLSSR